MYHYHGSTTKLETNQPPPNHGSNEEEGTILMIFDRYHDRRSHRCDVWWMVYVVFDIRE